MAPNIDPSDPALSLTYKHTATPIPAVEYLYLAPTMNFQQWGRTAWRDHARSISVDDGDGSPGPVVVHYVQLLSHPNTQCILATLGRALHNDIVVVCKLVSFMVVCV
jgi:hypothetical protein